MSPITSIGTPALPTEQSSQYYTVEYYHLIVVQLFITSAFAAVSRASCVVILKEVR